MCFFMQNIIRFDRNYVANFFQIKLRKHLRNNFNNILFVIFYLYKI